MTPNEKAAYAVSELEKMYPQAQCSLKYEKPYELLIATRLSAQCTDARVNIVTDTLFKRYKSLEDFANCDLAELEELIFPCGLYRTKAKSIKELCAMLIEKYGGTVPDTVEELVKLPGVGRKTANLIVGDVYHKPAVVTDTHCIRICRRLGLTDTDDPKKTEDELRAMLEPDKSNDFCHRLVNFGRDVCSARSPLCSTCALSGVGCYHQEKEYAADSPEKE